MIEVIIVMSVLLIIALVLMFIGLFCAVLSAFIISGRESRAEERREFEMMKKRNKKD